VKVRRRRGHLSAVFSKKFTSKDNNLFNVVLMLQKH